MQAENIVGVAGESHQVKESEDTGCQEVGMAGVIAVEEPVNVQGTKGMIFIFNKLSFQVL